MLYQAVLLGSHIFHVVETLGRHYDEYCDDVEPALIESMDRLDERHAARLILFVNQWRTHYQSTAPQLLKALQAVLPDLHALQSEAFLDADLSRPCLGSATVADVIERIFGTLLTCGARNESTGTAKILHLVHPRLFVMWDNAIAAGYAATPATTALSAASYAHSFLPRVKLVARRAVSEYERAHHVSRDQAIQALCGCHHTLTKVLDEYNYVKFTLQRPELWEAEFGP